MYVGVCVRVCVCVCARTAGGGGGGGRLLLPERDMPTRIQYNILPRFLRGVCFCWVDFCSADLKVGPVRGKWPCSERPGLCRPTA